MKAHPAHPAPSLHRAAALLVVATAAGAMLWFAPSSRPPFDLDGALDWWTREGTPSATMAIVRTVGLALAAWAMALAAFGVAVSVSRSPRASHLWVIVAPRSFRRMVATSVLVGVTATATISGAVEPPTLAPPVLIDLGDARNPEPVVGAPPLLIDLGPALEDETVEDRPSPENPGGVLTQEERANPDDTWTVARGDHLWRVAQETLEERGAETADEDITRYWRRLIETNRDVVGADPDLIHPGLVLRLPR